MQFNDNIELVLIVLKLLHMNVGNLFEIRIKKIGSFEPKKKNRYREVTRTPQKNPM